MVYITFAHRAFHEIYAEQGRVCYAYSPLYSVFTLLDLLLGVNFNAGTHR